MISPQHQRNKLGTNDTEIYKAHNMIENFAAKLKQYRAIGTRYDPSGGELSGVRLFWLLGSSG